MITFIFADSTEEMEKGKALIEGILNPKRDYAEWLNSEQFGFELFNKGYKSTSAATRKKYALKYGIDMRKDGKFIMFKNQLEKIPSRK
jgi:hypothetical protein